MVASLDVVDRALHVGVSKRRAVDRMLLDRCFVFMAFFVCFAKVLWLRKAQLSRGVDGDCRNTL